MRNRNEWILEAVDNNGEAWTLAEGNDCRCVLDAAKAESDARWPGLGIVALNLLVYENDTAQAIWRWRLDDVERLG
jgi:hypothetical protein